MEAQLCTLGEKMEFLALSREGMIWSSVLVFPKTRHRLCIGTTQ
jgi:hypothetical protein